MSMRLIFISILVTFVFSSCSKRLSQFTPSLTTQYGWEEGDLKKIQFYLSQDVVIYREMNSGESVISGGKIVLKDGKKIEQLTIKQHTPGVLLFLNDKKNFAIAFESESDSRYLIFGSNPNVNNAAYTLLGKNWTKQVGTLTYEGKEYQTNGFNGVASLLVNMKLLRKMDVESRVAKGRKVN